jgi:hypothetical protein
VLHAVTLLDNVSGLKARHLPLTKLTFGEVEFDAGTYLLDENFVVLRKEWPELVRLSRQRIKKSDGRDAVLTWIGLYRAAPRQYDQREGYYCGVGVWLLDAVASGEAVLSFLRKALVRLYSSMDAQRIPTKWRVEEIELSEVGINVSEIDGVTRSIKGLSVGQGLSDDRNKGTCFLDCSGNGDDRELASAIYSAQTSRIFERFSKMFIANSVDIVGDLRRKRRAMEVTENGWRVSSSAVDRGSFDRNQSTVYSDPFGLDVVQTLRKELKGFEKKVDDSVVGSDRLLISIRRLLIVLLVLCGGLVIETAGALIPKIFTSAAIDGVVKADRIPRYAPSSTQTQLTVPTDPGAQPSGLRASGCLDASTAGATVTKDQPSRAENSSTEVPTFPNSKEIECLARDLEELSSLIDRILPTLQRSAAPQKPPEQAHEGARKPLEASKSK